MSNLLDFLKYPYHQAIINNKIPLSIGWRYRAVTDVYATIEKSSSRGVSVTIWPKKLKEICEKKNIYVLE